ncbi:MAG: TatD family hydrolase [Arenimonas sp.]
MSESIFDSHSHLDAVEFDVDRAAVLSRAESAGVRQQLVPAVEQVGWSKLKAVCAMAPGLYPAYGLHPMFLRSHQPTHLEALQAWVEREKPVAIGECGLDFLIDDLDPEVQRYYFRAQLQIARTFDLPVIIHARRAVEEVIATIRSVGPLRGVVHSYSGSAEQARQLFDQGFVLGIGGPVTYDRARRLRSLVSTMPLHGLLLETDSPDQPDVLHRGQRNEPARIVTVLETVAALRNMPEQELARATRHNAERLFAIQPLSA